MRAFYAVVFDDIVQNSTPYFSDPTHSSLLGRAEKISFQVISNVFTGGPTLTVTVQHSVDGLTWQQRGTTPEIDRETLSWTDANNHVVYYDSAWSVGCLIRLRVVLGGSATVRVKITACGRARLRPMPAGEVVEPYRPWEVDPFTTDDELLDKDTCCALDTFARAFGEDASAVRYFRNRVRQDAWNKRRHDCDATPSMRSSLECACSGGLPASSPNRSLADG